MEGIIEGYDAVALFVTCIEVEATAEFDERLNGFSPRVAEERPLHLREFTEFFRQLNVGASEEIVGNVD